MPFKINQKWMIVTVAICSVTIIYFLFDPLQNSFFLRCPLHSFTGLKCPFCGLQQMIHHLLHGQLGLAFRDNPFVFLLGPCIILYFIGKKRGWKFIQKLGDDKSLFLLIIVALAFGVFRNFVYSC